MTLANQRGTVLTFIVIGLGLIIALSAGALYLTSTSTLSGLSANDQNQAYHLAKAGIEYAMITTMEDTTDKVFTLLNGNKFSLTISGNSIVSTGIVRAGTPYETKRKISVIKTNFSRSPGSSSRDDPISYKTPKQTIAGLIATDTATGQITLGQVGPAWGSQFGALWYTGNATSGNCQGGRCEFGTGFRAFFVFQINPSALGADGFTFTVFNGDTATNDIYSVGGDGGRGELLGYSGTSYIGSGATGYLDGNNRTTAGCPGTLGCEAGRGIQPPKIAVEFDPYNNYGSADVCASGSRRDGNETPNPRHHVAYVFWGTNANSSCSTKIGQNSYDDNRHNEGSDSSSDPRNSRRPSDGADPSYYNASTLSYNWLTNNFYAFRIEVTRSKDPVGGEYEYTMKSWIKPCADLTCSNYDEASSFANTKVAYTADTATLSRTSINLTEALHNKFSTFFYGWTMATGGATEEVKINRFRINFQI